jgi:hypothetical protein
MNSFEKIPFFFEEATIKTEEETLDAVIVHSKSDVVPNWFIVTEKPFLYSENYEGVNDLILECIDGGMIEINKLTSGYENINDFLFDPISKIVVHFFQDGDYQRGQPVKVSIPSKEEKNKLFQDSSCYAWEQDTVLPKIIYDEVISSLSMKDITEFKEYFRENWSGLNDIRQRIFYNPEVKLTESKASQEDHENFEKYFDKILALYV